MKRLAVCSFAALGLQVTIFGQGPDGLARAESRVQAMLHNARVRYSVNFRRTEEFYAYVPEAAADKSANAAEENRDCEWVRLDGVIMSRRETTRKHEGQMITHRVSERWDDKANIGDTLSESFIDGDLKTRQLYAKTRIFAGDDIGDISFHIGDKPISARIAAGEMKVASEADAQHSGLMRLEGQEKGGSLWKAWVDPKRDFMVMMSEKSPTDGRWVVRSHIDRAQEVDGHWAPQTYSTQWIHLTSGGEKVMTSADYEFKQWSFGDVALGDVTISTVHKTLLKDGKNGDVYWVMDGAKPRKLHSLWREQTARQQIGMWTYIACMSALVSGGSLSLRKRLQKFAGL